MRTMAVCLALGALMGMATFGRACSAEELPGGGAGVCDMVAEAAYAGAIEAGDGLPDGAYEQVMADCDWGGYSALTLNEQIGADGEAWLPACQFHGGCAGE